VRLDKFIGKSTALNKQQVLLALQTKQVSVNRKLITDPAFQVHENNHITLNTQTLIPRPFRYLLMHKPAGFICSNVDEQYPSVFNLLLPEHESGIDTANISTQPHLNSEEFHIVGRLDNDTTGLILITDNGRWSYHITLPTNDCKKLYRVKLSKPLSTEATKQFQQGLQLQGEAHLTRPAELSFVTDQEVLLAITEGKFHQVKRMFAALGNRVVSLHREKIGDIKLDVEVGKWRHLSQREINYFTL